MHLAVSEAGGGRSRARGEQEQRYLVVGSNSGTQLGCVLRARLHQLLAASIATRENEITVSPSGRSHKKREVIVEREAGRERGETRAVAVARPCGA